MFTDEAGLYVQSGKGGDGAVSFRREKYVPFGGPDGGDGGSGGDIVFLAKKSLRTLSHIRSRRVFKAKPGQAGGKNNRAGRSGDHCIIEVPLGTIIRDKESNETLGDLNEEGDSIVISKGGRGGKGNSHFVSSANQAPSYAQPGKEPEGQDLYLELKLIADIGLVGFPNAGKSTLLSRLSRANPKIANYPFTTLYPNLGVVHIGDYDSYILADIPGLIEGAHKGIGLGIRFLKHIERTKGLLFLIDIFAENPFNQFELLMNELKCYHTRMLEKPFYIALNKMDLFPMEERDHILKDFVDRYEKSSWRSLSELNPITLISAVSGEGMDPLKQRLFKFLKAYENKDEPSSSFGPL